MSEYKIEEKNGNLVYGPYCFSQHRNAQNNLLSWWVSKAGFIDAYYCFSSACAEYGEMELQEHAEVYARYWEQMHSRWTGKEN